MDPLARWFMPHQDNTRTGLMIGLASGKDSSLLHTYPLIPQIEHRCRHKNSRVSNR